MLFYVFYQYFWFLPYINILSIFLIAAVWKKVMDHIRCFLTENFVDIYSLKQHLLYKSTNQPDYLYLLVGETYKPIEQMFINFSFKNFVNVY